MTTYPTTYIHPETGDVLTRDVRRVPISYKGHTLEVDMPGWYPKDSNEGIHSQEDCEVSDRALVYLKSLVEQPDVAIAN